MDTVMAGGRMLPMLPAPRKVDPEWKCQQSGDCCSIPREVTMTKEEATLLVHQAPSTITLQFRPLGDDGRFVAMKAGPCPLFIFKQCLVYEHRPYNCRRFACMRPDPKTEKFEEDNSPAGCKNLSDRIKTSRVALRMAKLIQRRAQVWAVKHGWSQR